LQKTDLIVALIVIITFVLNVALVFCAYFYPRVFGTHVSATRARTIVSVHV
jgi:hypothetical protein